MTDILVLLMYELLKLCSDFPTSFASGLCNVFIILFSSGLRMVALTRCSDNLVLKKRVPHGQVRPRQERPSPDCDGDILHRVR